MEKYRLGVNNRLYLGNKMSGIAYFNAPWFDMAAARLNSIPGVEVFNPAEHDRVLGIDPMACPLGQHDEAAVFGIAAGKCLQDDFDWIFANSNGLILGPDWRTSKGAPAELALHQALDLPCWEYEVFLAHWSDEYTLYRKVLPLIMELPGRDLARAQESWMGD